MKLKSSIISVTAAAACVWFSLPESRAADGTWTNANTATWTTTTNWLDGVVADGAGSVAYFNQDYAATTAANIGNSWITLGSLYMGSANLVGTSRIINIRTGLSGTPTGGIIFDNNGSAALLSVYATGSGTFGLGPNSTAATRPATAVVLNDDLNIERLGTGNLLMHVNISITDGGSHTLRVLNTSATGGAVNFVAAYTGGTNYSSIADGNGVMSVSQESANTELWLYGINSYKGGTYISNGGVVRITADTGLGDTASALTFTGSGGTLYIKDATGAAFATSRAIVLNGNGTLDFSTGASVARSINSAISGDGVLTIKGANAYGSSAVKLWGNNTYTGGTVIDNARVEASINSRLGAAEGDVTIKNGGALIMGSTSLDAGTVNRKLILTSGGGSLGTRSSTGSWVWSGQITGDGGLIKYFSGDVILTNDNNDYTGGTTISEGRLIVNNNSGSGLGSGNVLVVTSGTSTTGFGGFGNVSGGVTMQSGTALQVGYGSVGGFSVGSLTLLGNITIGFSETVGTLNINGLFDAGNHAVTIDLTGYTGGDAVLVAFDSLANATIGNFVLTGVSATDYTLSLDTVTNTLSLQAVPEPAMAAMVLGLGAMGACVLRGRRRA